MPMLIPIRRVMFFLGGHGVGETVTRKFPL